MNGAAVGSRADERRRHILDAAVAVFSRRGYRATSMNDVAAAVGLSKPALYHYVRTKQDLLVAIYEGALDESLRRAEAIVAAAGSPREALHELLVERVAYTCEHQDLLKICFEEESELPEELAEPILQRRRTFEDLVHAALLEHLARAGAELAIGPKVYVNACLGAANWAYKWYDPTGPRAPRELGTDIATVLLATLPDEEA